MIKILPKITVKYTLRFKIIKSNLNTNQRNLKYVCDIIKLISFFDIIETITRLFGLLMKLHLM